MSSAAEPRRERRFIKRPDDKARDEKIAKVRAQINEKAKTLKELNNQMEKAVVPEDAAEKRKTLLNELNEIKKQQSGSKNQRQALLEQIKSIEQNMKRKIGEINTQTGKSSFKSIDEINNKIASINDLIATGTLKIVDERRYVKEMSSLRKLAKDFNGVQELQKLVDNDKAKIAELKTKANSLNNKEVQARYEAINKELDDLKQSTQGIYDKRKALFSKKDAIRKENDVLYGEMRSIRAAFDEEFTKFKEQMTAERERRAQEEKTYVLEDEKKELMQEKENVLQSAETPAFTVEIDSIHSLLGYFDPSYVKPQKSVLPSAQKSAPVNIRQVEMPDDVEIVKKDLEEFHVGTGGKKKKSKANKGRFSVDPDVISQLGDLSIALPMSKDDVPKAQEALKAKMEEFISKQDEATKEKAEKAKALAEKIEEKIQQKQQQIDQTE